MGRIDPDPPAPRRGPGSPAGWISVGILVVALAAFVAFEMGKQSHVDPEERPAIATTPVEQQASREPPKQQDARARKRDELNEKLTQKAAHNMLRRLSRKGLITRVNVRPFGLPPPVKIEAEVQVNGLLWSEIPFDEKKTMVALCVLNFGTTTARIRVVDGLSGRSLASYDKSSGVTIAGAD